MSCPFCKTDHPHCDSPGAILTRTTGCPEWDNREPRVLSVREKFLEELRRKVNELIGGGPEL